MFSSFLRGWVDSISWRNHTKFEPGPYIFWCLAFAWIEHVEWCSFPSGQRTSSLISSCGRKIDSVRVPTRSGSLLFSRCSSFGLLPLRQYEKTPDRKEKQGGDCENECPFCRVGQILLFWRNQETGIVLDKVYKPKSKLCRMIKIVCPEKLSSSYFWTDFSIHLCMEKVSTFLYLKNSNGRGPLHSQPKNLCLVIRWKSSLTLVPARSMHYSGDHQSQVARRTANIDLWRPVKGRSFFFKTTGGIIKNQFQVKPLQGIMRN